MLTTMDALLLFIPVLTVPSDICDFLVVQLDATGRPDESLVMEFVGPLKPSSETNLQCGQLLSFLLQKGQLKANICFQPFHSATLEVPVFKRSYCLCSYFNPLCNIISNNKSIT